MNLQLETGVPVLTVFVQGLLSFFSPCVLPLVPLDIWPGAPGRWTRRATSAIPGARY